MKNLLQFFLNIFGYNIIKSKNFRKINRTLDLSIKSLLKKNNPLIIDIGAHEGESINRFNSQYIFFGITFSRRFNCISF